MASLAGQAAGLAVGAAVGSIISPGAGTVMGAQIGAALGGTASSLLTSNTQENIETEALRLNLEQHRAEAAEKAAIHARNFRQALAHQVALAGMRGGSGSIGAQFASDAYRTFIEDQKDIEAGLSVVEAQGKFSQADITARREARDISAIGRGIASAFDAVNLNMPRQTPKGK